MIVMPTLMGYKEWVFIIQSFCHPPSTLKEGNPAHLLKWTAIYHLKAIIRGEQLGDTPVIKQSNVGHIYLNKGFRPQKTDVSRHPTFTEAFIAVYQLSESPLHRLHTFCMYVHTYILYILFLQNWAKLWKLVFDTEYKIKKSTAIFFFLRILDFFSQNLIFRFFFLEMRVYIL